MADADDRRRHSEEGAGPEDEEARLLPSEHFEIEDGEGSPSASHPGTDPEPETPKPHTITPLFPSLQHLPITLANCYLPTVLSRRLAAAALTLLWLTLFFTPLIISTRPVRDGSGQYIVNLDCVDTLWPRRSCGLDGIDCQPFSNSSFAFRCPANCAGVMVLNPRPVGNQEVNYRPLVIGNEAYRGDSFVCGAAIHAGIVSDAAGGCGRVTRVGERSSFESTESNGIESIGFNSYFPLSYTLEEDPSIPTCRTDIRWLLLMVTLPASIIATLFSTSPSYTFTFVSLALFAHTAFASDPPPFRTPDVLPDLVSIFARRLLPASFCALAIYRTCVRRTLGGLTAQLEKVVLWLGAYWIGVLSNYTFSAIPIQRLTPHDLEQQPGAKVALAVIIAVIALIVLGQAYHFRSEGRLRKVLKLYAVLGAGVILLVLLPGLHLRLHHYVFSLLLLPGTAMQTRPSLLYQGLLLGLFANGIARWGFDSVLQTAGALRNDAAFDSIVPSVTALISPSNATFSFDAVPEGFDGVTGFVNDVERYRGFFADGAEEFVWEREEGMELDEYFRFAFIRDRKILDFGATEVWFGNGSYHISEQNQTAASLRER